MKLLISILLGVCMLLAMSISLADEQRIAIVVSDKSGIMAMTSKEVRRVYLGASVVLNGIEVKPILNKSDKLAGEVFLQKGLFMSAEAYERQIIAHWFQGGSRPKSYENMNDLLLALHKDGAAITFMFYETAIKTSGIRIIGNL